MSELQTTVLIGVGGCGVNVVSRLHEIAPDPVTHIAVDTDAQVLEKSGVARYLLIGRDIAEGLGTGGDREIGAQCAERDSGPLRDLVIGADLVILTAGLGGGTGTGATTAIAQIAAEQGAAVIAFVSMPFYFEGAGRRKAAEQGLKELKQVADAVVVLPNQRMFDWAEARASMEATFATVDHMVLKNIQVFQEVLESAGLINITMADMTGLLRQSDGLGVMAYGEGQGNERVQDALNQLLDNPVLGRTQIVQKAAGMLIAILGGADLTLANVQEVVNSVTELARRDVRLRFGTALREDFNGRICIALLATEQWQPDDDESVEPVSVAGSEDTTAQVPSKPSRSRSKKKKQTTLEPAGAGEGRFKHVEPTIYRGEDLDIPTFRRKGIQLMS